MFAAIAGCLQREWDGCSRSGMVAAGAGCLQQVGGIFAAVAESALRPIV